jgi:hypothetical protein
MSLPFGDNNNRKPFDFGQNTNSDEDNEENYEEPATNAKFDFGAASKKPKRGNNRSFARNKMSDMRGRPIPQWLIRDLIFQQQVGVVYAPPGSFKSFVVLGLCSMLVHGMEWQGHNMKPRRVIYVAGEGFPMFYNRRRAWFKHHGIQEQDDGLEVIEGAIDLTDPAEVTAFILAMQKDKNGVGLMVFDTLSTCTAGQNESDSAVMTTVVEHGKLIAKSLGIAVLFIHHPGKDLSRGSRGHSSLLGNIDTEWLLERNGKDMACKLTVTKQKDGEDGQVFNFIAHKIPLGMLDEDGVEMTSLAIAPYAGKDLPGEAVDTSLADRGSIAAVMKIDESVSMSKLAGRLTQVLGQRASAIERIKQAVPEQWTRIRKGDGVVELRRVVTDGVGKAHKIEMRRAVEDTGETS